MSNASKLIISNLGAEKAVIVLNIRSYKKWSINVRSFVSYSYEKLGNVWVEKTQPKIQPFCI
jgi:hypothetical protein